MRVLLALSAAVLTLLILTFLWQTYGRAADRGWVVLGGYPLALTVAWGVAFLCVLAMEGGLALPRYSKAIGVVLCAAVFLAVWYFFGFDVRMNLYYGEQFFDQNLWVLYKLYWYVLVVLFVVLLVFNAALFLGPNWRTRLLVSAGFVLLVISPWLGFRHYDTVTVWFAGSLALWWEAALWRRERGTLRRMLEKKDPLAVLALIGSFVVPMVFYGLYDTLTSWAY
jgi:hypothetical protein